MKKRVIAAILISVLILPTLTSCGINKSQKTHSKTYLEYFDTVCTVSSYANDSKEEFEKNCGEIEEMLSRYHKMFDIYMEYSKINNLKTVNLNAGKKPVKVDSELVDFLIYCKEMYDFTKGKMNVMYGSVLSLWHTCREEAEENGARIPSDEEIKEAQKHTSIEPLVIDRENFTVYISDSSASIDVGAVGKGYATQKIGEMLEEKGVTSYVLDIGSNIKTLGGKKNGEGFVTGITNPDKTSKDSFVKTVEIMNTSCVTSGDYERYFMYENEKYHHIIDTQSGMPARYFSSVTVITEDSALADVLSTALFCMSYEEGKKLVTSIVGVEVLWVDTNYGVKMTEGFEKLCLN